MNANERKKGLIMCFEFNKYAEVTELAVLCNKEYQARNYNRLFLRSEKSVFSIARLSKNPDGSCAVEYQEIKKSKKSDCLTYATSMQILTNDDFETLRCNAYDSVKSAIQALGELTCRKKEGPPC
ncbi:hypothetical protein J3492_00100 [Psychrobacter sp. F1192]|uniref:Uncharacterized protein n=1 Tax=Psychrobacter coccoides TaxID=2818440 RepID=A0ABS3NJN3_9GAMM|nr:hypothetical protein [Psychrobacter coccoides]MBO1529614.1 hypothetical protein [Psychrobacter coccoides]